MWDHWFVCRTIDCSLEIHLITNTLFLGIKGMYTACAPRGVYYKQYYNYIDFLHIFLMYANNVNDYNYVMFC